MTEEQQESPADRYARLAATLTTTIEAVPADRWDAQTACEEWTARDIVQHLADTSAWQATKVDLVLPTVAAADDPVAAWTTTRDAVLEVMRNPAEGGRSYESMFGPTTLAETYGSFYCFDLIVHRWDIAHATGVDDTIPAADLAWVGAMAEQMGDTMRENGVTGPAVEVSADADEQTRVLGLLGRRVGKSDDQEYGQHSMR